MATPLTRRQLLRYAVALGSVSTGSRLAARILAGGADAAAHGDLCATPPRFDNALLVPRAHGPMGRLLVDGRPIALRAMPNGRNGSLAFGARENGREFLDPTLVVQSGTRVRLNLDNRMAEPTVAHWHGLTIDTANDGNGDALVAPGESFEYDFVVRNRASMYWYHPHPHGATGAQTYRGLFGLLAVEDDEETALRRALELVPGETEIPLVLHDVRAGARNLYSPSADDSVHGWYGDEAQVNFTSRPFLDVSPRRYRFRILNASNARIYRLALRRDDGNALPFDLIGTDGGLLERAIHIEETFLAPAERIDILADFSAIAQGRSVLLESRAFDPMHGETHTQGEGDAPAEHQGDAHAGHAHVHAGASGAGAMASSSDGGAFAILNFRVRGRSLPAPPLPSELSAPISVASGSSERPLRLGFAKGRWRINDRVFDMNATPILVPRAAVETWLIRNYYTSMPHAMHLHGFQFRVLERETSPEQLAPLVVDQRGRVASDLGWKDTVLVWPGESVRIAIDFRLPFEGEQIYPFHCHNLEHEDGGMMLRVKVG